MLRDLVLFSIEIFAFELLRASQKLYSVVNCPIFCHFWRKVLNTFGLSFSTCCQMRTVSFVRWINYILKVRHLHALLRVFPWSRVLFLVLFFKCQIAQSHYSPTFKNLLLEDNFCRVFQGGVSCGNQIVIVTTAYVIMSISIANYVLIKIGWTIHRWTFKFVFISKKSS